MSENKSWTRIRVSKFTWNIHPDDWQEGLPLPGELELDHRYRGVLVQKDDSGQWTGKTTNVKDWINQNKPQTDANPTQAQAAQVRIQEKAAGKRGRKRKEV